MTRGYTRKGLGACGVISVSMKTENTRPALVKLKRILAITGETSGAAIRRLIHEADLDAQPRAAEEESTD